jgi:pSer/pThr/pTyr-binding forkhead associated (FHA) protein
MTPNPEGGFFITGIEGPVSGREFVIVGEEVRLGRTSENDIVLDEKNVSRHHASLWVQNERLWIQDMESKNGVLVNDEKVETRELKNGDRIRIGLSVFRVGLEGSGAAFASVWKIDRKRIALYLVPVFVVSVLGILSARQPNRSAPISQNSKPASVAPISMPARTSRFVKQDEILAWKGRAEMAMRTDDMAAALPLLQNFLAARPDDAHARALLVRAQTRLSQLISRYYENGVMEYEKLYYDRAIQEWQKVLALSQSFDPDTYRRTEEKIREVRQKLALAR